MRILTKNGVDEVSLLTSLRNGDEGAFEALFDLFWADLYKAAFIRLKSHGEAEDMVQDIFTDLWERREHIVINTSLQAYLRTALKYKIIKWVSRANVHEAAISNMLHRMQTIEYLVLDTIAAKDLNKNISSAVADFPETMRRIFLLRLQDYTVSEISNALGLAVQTVKNHNTEALRRLRIMLADKHPDLSKTFMLSLALLTQSS